MWDGPGHSSHPVAFQRTHGFEEGGTGGTTRELQSRSQVALVVLQEVWGLFSLFFLKINQPRSKRYQKLQLEVSQVSGRSSPVLWLRVIFGEIGVFSEIEAALGDQRHPGLGRG